MINRLSNLINRNRSAAKISQVLCSNEHADGDPDNEGVGWGKEGEVGDGREEESWCKDGNDWAPNSPEQSILIMIMIILYIIFHLPD